MKSAPLKLVILMPVYNDWDAAGVLLEQIDSTLAGQNVRPLILLIRDLGVMECWSISLDSPPMNVYGDTAVSVEIILSWTLLN